MILKLKIKIKTFYINESNIRKSILFLLKFL
jgi:hypothetical protein